MLIFDVKLTNKMGRKSTKKHVFLTGYMGSGKSTIGLMLSEQLSMRFIDLDTEIEKSEKISVSEVFEKKGENYFRIKESNMLKEIIQYPDSTIIALGGGCVSNQDNLNLILNDGLLIYLEASVSTIVERIKNDADKRPLLAQYKPDENLINFIQSHLTGRLKYYQKADFTIDTNGKNKNQILSELIAIVNSNTN